MAGRGQVEAEDSLAHNQLFSLGKDLTWNLAKDPIHFDKPIAGVGPGRTIGLVLLEADQSKRIGLIPTAVGGSAIELWKPGELHEPTGIHPYDDMLTRAKFASRFGNLKAVFWHQGESDSNAEKAPVYKEGLLALISRLREDLQIPKLVIIIGQLSQFDDQEENQWRDLVNQAHIDIAEEDPFVKFVGSENLTHKGDGVHFDSESMREMGRRYAKAYLQLTQK